MAGIEEAFQAFAERLAKDEVRRQRDKNIEDEINQSQTTKEENKYPFLNYVSPYVNYSTGRSQNFYGDPIKSKDMEYGVNVNLPVPGIPGLSFVGNYGQQRNVTREFLPQEVADYYNMNPVMTYGQVNNPFYAGLKFQTNFQEGGLTKTVPPVKGPDSQGVESLFRRRYN